MPMPMPNGHGRWLLRPPKRRGRPGSSRIRNRHWSPGTALSRISGRTTKQHSAHDRTTYIQGVVAETGTLVNTEADATHTEEEEIASALHTEAEEDNAAATTRAVQEADAVRDYDLEVHAARRDRELQDASSRRDRRNQEAEDVETYQDAIHVIDAARWVDSTVAVNNWSIANAEDELVLEAGGGTATYDAAMAENVENYNREMAGVNRTYTYGAIAAREILAAARGQADYDFTVALHASEQTERNRTADAQYTRDVAFAAARRDATITAINAALERDDSFAGAIKTFEDTVDPARETAEDHIAEDEVALNQNASADGNTFRSGVAGDYAQRVSAFNTGTPTPWGGLQSDLAGAESAYLSAITTADSTFETSFGQAQINEIQSLTSARTILDGALAGADYTEETADAADRAEYLTTLANRQYDYATAAALAEKTHTKAVVAENKTYQDDLAAGRQTLQNAINAALWTRERAIADADYDLAWDVIDSTEYAAESDAAYYQERVSQAAAHTARANAAAQSRLTWTQNVGNHHVTYAQDMATASNTLATAVKGARILFAQEVADAENAWETTAATADEAYNNAAESAETTFRTESTAADTAYDAQATAADDDDREVANECRRYVSSRSLDRPGHRSRGPAAQSSQELPGGRGRRRTGFSDGLANRRRRRTDRPLRRRRRLDRGR